VGEARIETMPQLEIYADDVKCSHGATVGQMNDDAILYMRQRGLSLADAKRLQIEGFVDDVVLHSVVEGSEAILAELLADKLTKL
jgi:Fe-S cluster assembly protein SufD